MLDYVSTFQITGEQWTAYTNELPPSGFFFFWGGAAFVDKYVHFIECSQRGVRCLLRHYSEARCL